MFHPYKLWSLWDMFRIAAEIYLDFGEMLAEFSTKFHQKEISSSTKVNPGDVKEGLIKAFTKMAEDHKLKELLIKLKEHTDTLNLKTSSAILEKSINNLPENYREFNLITDVIKSEIKSIMFLFIPSHRDKYYDWELSPYLVTSFPIASKEFTRAGKCFAVGEYTACVFHSMRAAEIALRAMAQHLNVVFPYPIDLMDWHNLINNIESVIKKAEQQPKSAVKDKELKFCSAAASQFRYFKEAYRKHVSHARETYNEEEAVSIMERTAEFVKSLSTEISEP